MTAVSCPASCCPARYHNLQFGGRSKVVLGQRFELIGSRAPDPGQASVAFVTGLFSTSRGKYAIMLAKTCATIARAFNHAFPCPFYPGGTGSLTDETPMIRALQSIAYVAVAALMLCLVALGSLLASPAAEAQTTREQVIAFLGEVETQIERIATAQGRFMQISDAGQIVRGDIYISRPGRMRFDYDDPSPALLVADGRFIGTYNTKDETSAHRQISQTPLKFLLNKDPDLVNGVNVLKIERVAESVLVTMQDRRNANQGQLILVLDTQTLELRAWQVIDDKGERTTVRLESMAYGVPLPDALFQRPGF